MSSRLRDVHHSTLHAFLLAALEMGYTEFEFQLVTSPKGGVEFCISPVPNSKSVGTCVLPTKGRNTEG
jgi:hypothetical protein